MVESRPYLIDAIRERLCCDVTADSTLVGVADGRGAGLGGAVTAGAADTTGMFMSGCCLLEKHIGLSSWVERVVFRFGEFELLLLGGLVAQWVVV